MAYLIIAVIFYTLGIVIGLKSTTTRTILCPYNNRQELVNWAQNNYPNTPPSFFEKRNKTYLISLWYTQPDLNSPELPKKIYNKEGIDV